MSDVQSSFKDGQVIRLELPTESSHAALPGVCASLAGTKIQLYPRHSSESIFSYSAPVQLAGYLSQEPTSKSVFGTDLWGDLTVSASEISPGDNKPVLVKGTVTSASQQSADNPPNLSLFFDESRGYFKCDHNFGSVSLATSDMPRNLRGHQGGTRSHPASCTGKVTGELHLRTAVVEQWLRENTATYLKDGAITHTVTVSHKAVTLPMTDIPNRVMRPTRNWTSLASLPLLVSPGWP